MRTVDFIRLGVVAILITYLLFRHLQRARLRRQEARWTGHGIDVAGLADRLERVRADFASEISTRRAEISRRQRWLESARLAVARLAYFRAKGVEPSAWTEPNSNL
ncbi:MAG TPA: hypothetical protein PLX89_12455 [Verrucomicrobiota bacterium]|nr:hypothetical protein [Verrucomicrobiales bacterium]HRI13804.1 hypothetical protein [Verrucomicrobiota bacterium]